MHSVHSPYLCWRSSCSCSCICCSALPHKDRFCLYWFCCWRCLLGAQRFRVLLLWHRLRTTFRRRLAGFCSSSHSLHNHNNIQAKPCRFLKHDAIFQNDKSNHGDQPTTKEQCVPQQVQFKGSAPDGQARRLSPGKQK